MKAIFNEIVLADSDQTVKVDGTYYFPPNTVKKEYLEESSTHTSTPGKGEAAFYHVKVKGEVKLDAAWYYPKPEKKTEKVRNYIAFSDEVELKD
jgi:uncharacterized protein (DUF427 family)